MKVVGITGGIGSGKTTVCSIFAALGVPVYYADDRAKFLMANDPNLKKRIVEVFGDESFRDGKLNRAYLADRVFSSDSQLDLLNTLVHPAVAEDFKQWVLQQHEVPYVLKEAAILFESGSYRSVDGTVLVTAPEHIRIERVMKRDGVSKDAVLSRMSKQWTDEQKVTLADHIIENDGYQLVVPQVIELHRKFSAP